MNNIENLIKQYNYKVSMVLNAKTIRNKEKAEGDLRTWSLNHKQFINFFDLSFIDVNPKIITLTNESQSLLRIRKKVKTYCQQTRKKTIDFKQTDCEFSKL